MTTATASKKSANSRSRLSETNYQTMTEKQLWSEVERNLDACADHLKIAAKCVGALKRRGVDVTRLDARLLKTLTKIDEGTLLPEAAIKFIVSPLVLTAVSQLPTEKQAELVNNPFVNVDRKGETGEGSVQVQVNRLSKQEVSQVSGDGKILRSNSKRNPWNLTRQLINNQSSTSTSNWRRPNTRSSRTSRTGTISPYARCFAGHPGN